MLLAELGCCDVRANLDLGQSEFAPSLDTNPRIFCLQIKQSQRSKALALSLCPDFSMASIRTSSASLLSCTDGANPPCVAGEVNQEFENLMLHRVVSSYLPFISLRRFIQSRPFFFAKTELRKHSRKKKLVENGQLFNTKTKILD